MTPEAAAKVLGLRGAESAAEIQAIYLAQARALDARISVSAEDARAGYVRDREEVELARLALLGSQAGEGSQAEGAGKPKRAKADAAETVFVAVLIIGMLGTYFGFGGWYAWAHPPAGFRPGEFVLFWLLAVVGWAVGLAVFCGVIGGIGKLFRRDWIGGAVTIYTILTVLSLGAREQGDPVRDAIGLHIGSMFLTALVAAGLAMLGGLAGWMKTTKQEREQSHQGE